MFSKRVNRYQGDGFLSVGARTGAIKLTVLLRIGGTDFLHFWVTDSIWLERAESLITKQ